MLFEDRVAFALLLLQPPSQFAHNLVRFPGFVRNGLLNRLALALQLGEAVSVLTNSQVGEVVVVAELLLQFAHLPVNQIVLVEVLLVFFQILELRNHLVAQDSVRLFNFNFLFLQQFQR